MICRANRHVRMLDLILNTRQRDRWHEFDVEFARSGVYTYTIRQGPLINGGGKIVPGQFQYTLLIDESFADKVLMELKGV